MSKSDSANLESSATDESTDNKSDWRQFAEDSVTDGPATRIKTPLDKETIRSVVTEARSLSPDNECVTIETDLLKLNNLALSSLLFIAHTIHSAHILHHGAELSGKELQISLRVSEVHFEGDGVGYIDFTIHADAETHEVDSLTVDVQLVSEIDQGLVEDDEVGRPQKCQCWPGADIPCWPCYREGFETPNKSS